MSRKPFMTRLLLAHRVERDYRATLDEERASKALYPERSLERKATPIAPPKRQERNE